MPFGADPFSQWLIISGLLVLSAVVVTFGIAMLDASESPVSITSDRELTSGVNE